MVLVDANKTDAVDAMVDAIHQADAVDWAVFDTSSTEKIDRALALEPKLMIMPRAAAASDVATLLAKYKDHRSITYDNAPMPYTLRLTRDGVSIHGSNVRWGYATHGCIGVPVAFAAKLFAAVRTGDEVLIVPGKPRPHGA